MAALLHFYSRVQVCVLKTWQWSSARCVTTSPSLERARDPCQVNRASLCPPASAPQLEELDQTHLFTKYLHSVSAGSSARKGAAITEHGRSSPALKELTAQEETNASLSTTRRYRGSVPTHIPWPTTLQCIPPASPNSLSGGLCLPGEPTVDLCNRPAMPQLPQQEQNSTCAGGGHLSPSPLSIQWDKSGAPGAPRV